MSVGEKLKALLDWIDGKITYFKGLSLFGVISALVVAYFHSLSAYQDRVATLAKDDLTAASQTFAEISSNISGAMALQRQLISDFYTASQRCLQKRRCFLTKDARAIYKNYSDSYAALHQNYNLLARKPSYISIGRATPNTMRAENPRRSSIHQYVVAWDGQFRL